MYMPQNPCERVEALERLTGVGEPSPKKFNYSTVENAEVIEQTVKDYALLMRKSVSRMIEAALVAELLPENDEALSIMVRIYRCVPPSDGPDAYGIKEALSDLFFQEFSRVNAGHVESCGPHVRMLYEFTREIIEAHLDEVRGSLRDSGDGEDALASLADAWNGVCDLIEKDDRRNGRMMVSYRDMLAELRTDTTMRMDRFFVVLLKCPDSILGSSAALKFASSMLDHAGHWDDTPQERLRFSSLVDKFCFEREQWTAASMIEGRSAVPASNHEKNM